MRIAVLGSGIIGVSTAWFAAQDGHEVIVLDRQSGPAQETSFANGCQISVSYSEPWANPGAPLKLLKWLARDDAPLLFRPRLDFRQWLWGLAFLRECIPGRLPHNIRAMVALSTYSRDVLQATRAATGIEYDLQARGILNFYSDPKEFEGSQAAADVMRQYGVNRRIVSADEVVQIEPALAPSRHQIVGGDYTAEDESGDIYQFTTKLAAKAAERGVKFEWNTQITRLVQENGKITAVEVIRPDGGYDTIKADAFVVAMGSFSPQLVQPLGVPCLIYPTKGYSATYPILKPDQAPLVSLSDSGFKIVFSRIGNRIRVAGTAELSGYTRDLNPVRCEALTRRTKELFGDTCDYNQARYWTALRPSTPSNVPLIGRTRIPNLYLNTGHGTLGWTMGCGSGKALADLLSNRQPEVEFAFLGANGQPDLAAVKTVGLFAPA
jgi:D-amino-acid dehydrogenase